ncbi:MAG: phosphoribosylformylglycinamidine cyclo-ligase [Phycisphaeraceae bacterium]|nr:phosphoribosylformylglycinamidine cyclo-ligase [Phycisphaeraceae bacterium]
MPRTTPSPSRQSGAGRSARGLTYADSGVNLEDKDAFTESLVSTMRRTFGPRVIDNPGGFAGMFRLDFNQKLFAKNYKDPVLVACCDGVGTKVKLASEYRKFDTVGIDLVAMSINDLIVQGAEPLFFLDYIAVGKVDRPMLTDIVRGVAEGCRQSECALLGGETAEMPDIYAPGEFDLAGFAVGVVELKRATDPERVEKGDLVLGLESSGIHSNGYSLVRKVVSSAGLDLGAAYEELVGEDRTKGRRRSSKGPAPKTATGRNGKIDDRRAGSTGKSTSQPDEPTLGEVLLTPTRIYAPAITRLLRQYKVKKIITGMANITGSGLEGNLCRALHPKVDALIDPASWPVPPVFTFLQTHGNISTDEMRRVFNMGVGYTLIVKPKFAAAVKEKLEKLGERVHVIGKVVKGKGEVRYEL